MLFPWQWKNEVLTTGPQRNSSLLIFKEYVIYIVVQISVVNTLITTVQFSCSVMSDSLWPHKLQHARPPCPSPTSRVYPNSCSSSRWCHPAISSSVPFFSCPQSLPASGSFPMSQLFTWSAKVLEFQLHHTLKNTVWINISQDVKSWLLKTKRYGLCCFVWTCFSHFFPSFSFHLLFLT